MVDFFDFYDVYLECFCGIVVLIFVGLSGCVENGWVELFVCYGV